MLGLGRIFARVLMVAAVPILARLYDATDFGIFGVYNSACAVLSVAAALCYERGIVPAGSDAEAAALTYLSLLMTVLTCSVLELIAVLVFPFFRHIDSIEGLQPIVLVLPFAVGVNAVVLVLLEWANRTHHDRIMSSNSIVRAGSMVGIQIGAGWLFGGGQGLIFGQLGGSMIAAALLALRLPWPRLPAGGRRQHLVATARQLSSFPLFSFPRALLEAAANMAVMGLLTGLFGPAEVGLYWMAQRVVSIPSQVIDEPLRQIFYRSASTSLARSDGVIRPLVLTMLTRAAIVIPFLTAVVLSGTGAFDWILGANWGASALYAKIMVVGWAAGEIAMPMHSLPVFLGRLRYQFIAELVGQSVRIGIVLAAYGIGDFVLCLSLTSAYNVVFAIGFAVGLFWPASTRSVARGRSRLVTSGAAAQGALQ